MPPRPGPDTSSATTNTQETVNGATLSDSLALRFPALGIDADDPLEREALTLVHDSLQSALDRGLFDAPLTDRSRQQYTSSSAVFETWCATRDDPIDPLALSPAARTAVVATFLTWLATDIDVDDPAHGFNAGQRQRRTALKGPSVNAYVNAIRWWATQHNLEDPVPSAAASDLSSARLRAQPTRQAVPLGREEVRTLLATIRRGPVACGKYPSGMSIEARPKTSPERFERWVAGNAASILVQFCAGLRISERLRIRDEWVTVGEDRITVRWPSTKANGHGRSVDIFGDPDVAMCPVRALVRWLDVADQQGLDRHGLLLPDVTTRGLRTTPCVQSSAAMFLRIARAAGLEEHIDPKRHYLGTHSIRRGTATSLASLGVDLEQVRRLLGHAKASTTLRYVDRATNQPTDWSSELGL